LQKPNKKSNASNHQMVGRHGFSNIHRKDKIHLIQPEKLPNSKQTEYQHMEKRREDQASETTPYPRTDL
jgi:hypothetical protein